MILLLYSVYIHDYSNISLQCAILHCKFYLAPAWINEKIVILIDWLSKIQISNFIEYQLFFILIVSCKIWRKYCLYTSKSLQSCKSVKLMKKCSKNSVFFTIPEFGASIFGRSNGPNISGFRIIRISGLVKSNVL